MLVDASAATRISWVRAAHGKDLRFDVLVGV